LRDAATIRPLSPSLRAEDTARLAQQELRDLFRTGGTGLEVLGLLAAARGGLSGPDLAGLAKVPLWEAEDIVRTGAGRAFARRPDRWNPEDSPEVYLLAHEELQAAAAGYLQGSDLLEGYYGRLHAWAGTWRDRGWPPQTPHYLLDGYPRLLAGLGDLERLASLALDTGRQDRMLAVTGGDAAALAEIRTALDLIAACDAPDLAAALALACRRDQLTSRNTHIPVSLPAVWATLGQAVRAEALATSITAPYEQARALAQLVEALAGAGQHGQAAAVAGQAEAVARSITDPYEQARALAQLAEALADAGQVRAANQVAAAACATGEWTTAATAVLSLNPAAFPALACILDVR
jgi:hypothetical protein